MAKAEKKAVCKHCGKSIWFDPIHGRGWRHDDMGYYCYTTVAEPKQTPKRKASR